MKLPLVWLRDFVALEADVRTVADRLAACGFEVASIDGDTIDFEITANRPDCLTITGLAREVATAFDLELRAPTKTASARGPREEPARATGSGAPVAVKIEDDRCGRYVLGMADVRIGPSPAWLADRLLACGIRPINNVVDITNYVMLETHPMHAFDAARLAGPAIRIRGARAGETLVTLDGQTRALEEGMLVVADRDRPVAIAGVMGGANSEVSASTTCVAFESAWWRPTEVRRTGRRLALKTEAGARFERGMDIDGPVRAMRRALELVEAIGAGRPSGPAVDLYPEPFAPIVLRLGRAHLDRLLGDRVPDAEVERILSRLGFTLSREADGWRVDVPHFRVDVRREADLIEEVGRHWGFDRIPATFPVLRAAPPPMAASVALGRTVRRVLIAAGLQEAATFTFIEAEAAAPFVDDPASMLVSIANPLSEKFAVLRPSLLPGLLDALIYSRRRETPDVRLFEAGSVFSPAGERQAVAWVLTGAGGEHWSGAAARGDFFDAKGLAELVGRTFGLDLEAEREDRPWYVAGRSARIVAADAGAGRRTLGSVGQIRSELAAARGLGDGEPIVAGELSVDALAAPGHAARRVAPIPRFPSIVRDLSILVDQRLPAAAVRGTIRASAPPTLVSVREFDRYQGRGVPAGQISLSLRLTFRAADRTLTDAEVQQGADAIVAALVAQHGAKLRGT